jgi:TRAP transporter 4TM/12TM fusion protein
MEEGDKREQSRSKEFSRKWLNKGKAITIIAVAMSLFQLYTAGYRPLPAMQQRSIHLTFVLLLTFLIFPLKKLKGPEKQRGSTLFDIVFVILSFLVGIYIFLEYENLSYRSGSPNFLDCLVSLIAMFLVTEATRRMMGLAICIVILIGIAYVAFGVYLPPVIAHSGYSFERVVTHMFLTTEGILGVALGVSATVIVVFLIFGAFLEHSGTSPLFTNLAYGIFGRFKGGPAKAAILGSCLFGMISGSQAANVAAVGVFTIPLMIKGGYKPIMAGAIEAVGSTGGMIMPPVMGAAAFIIPEIIGGTYIDVVKAAIIPALLYYMALFMVVEIQASKFGLKGLSKKELPKIRTIIKENGHMVVPILVLLYFLIIEMSSATKAAFWAILSSVLISMVRRNTFMTPSKIISALEKGGKNSLIVANACASAGIITGVITLTGMGLRFSEALISFAGGNLIVLLILTMFASLIIGLPLPPVTCYIILAILAAPAMIKLGVDPMAAHLFVFFFGILGNITPPVAPTSFAAAGLSGSDPFKTTNLSFLISAPSYIIPYMFVYTPELLLKGSLLFTPLRIFSSFLGISAMAIGLQGFLFRDLHWSLRILIVGAGILLVHPDFKTDILGYVLLGVIFVWQRYRKKPL